ncbi:MAG TPA: phage holin family protein [Bacteroidia bacterium]|nr:phage holin family protein [Bacteroidia bacterium]
MRFIVKILISTFAILVTSFLLPSVHLHSIYTAIIVALVLAFLNAIVKPIMIIITIPITVFTLGLFLIVINAFIIILASRLVSGFDVDGFGTALIFGIVLWIVNGIFEKLNKALEKNNF